MENNTGVIGIIEGEKENQRLELVLAGGESPHLVLKLATYAEGLGWHTQKTIHIDPQQADELYFLLGGARHLLKQAGSGAKSTTTNLPQAAQAQVVNFVPPLRKLA